MGQWLAALVLALGLAGCAQQARQPAPQAVPEPPGPGLVGWRSIGFSNEMFESGYVQERELNTSGPVRRAWIMLNLRESIPIPETGGRALSVRFVGEYRCAERQWRPLEGAWFARRNAQQPVHAERPRRSGFREAAPGTLGGAFLDAACGLCGGGKPETGHVAMIAFLALRKYQFPRSGYLVERHVTCDWPLRPQDNLR
jgi:hypothetical protein